MDANQDITLGQWPTLKGQVKQQWSKLTDDDIARLSGRTEELVGALRQKYGYGKVQAEIEINNWLRFVERVRADSLLVYAVLESSL
jgi:uncharacterized protein YjbJ (UPF0337 family)